MLPNLRRQVDFLVAWVSFGLFLVYFYGKLYPEHVKTIEQHNVLHMGLIIPAPPYQCVKESALVDFLYSVIAFGSRMVWPKLILV